MWPPSDTGEKSMEAIVSEREAAFFRDLAEAENFSSRPRVNHPLAHLITAHETENRAAREAGGVSQKRERRQRNPYEEPLYSIDVLKIKKKKGH